jgi:exportin-1
MYEKGLETLLTLLQILNSSIYSAGPGIADLFYKTYYFDLLNELLSVLTDSMHKSGFKLQIENLSLLIQVVEYGQISENLFDAQTANKNYIINYLVDLLSKSFTNLNKIQVETFTLALFNKCYNLTEFKVVIRDFLTTLKSFSGNNEELFEEERKVKFKLI